MAIKCTVAYREFNGHQMSELYYDYRDFPTKKAANEFIRKFKAECKRYGSRPDVWLEEKKQEKYIVDGNRFNSSCIEAQMGMSIWEYAGCNTGWW